MMPYLSDLSCCRIRIKDLDADVAGWQFNTCQAYHHASRLRLKWPMGKISPIIRRRFRSLLTELGYFLMRSDVGDALLTADEKKDGKDRIF